MPTNEVVTMVEKIKLECHRTHQVVSAFCHVSPSRLRTFKFSPYLVLQQVDTFSRMYFSMSTLVKKGIVKGKVLVDNVT